MPKKTITKISAFVILAAFAAAGCHSILGGYGYPPDIDNSKSPFSSPEVVGKLESGEIKESSGISVSNCQKNVLWTLNDSGGGPYIYAIDPSGRSLGTWQIPDAKNTDWEGIAGWKDKSGNCFIFIGEIGNSDDNKSAEQKIYRIREPAVNVADSASSKKNPIETAPADILSFVYPDGRQNAETLMVHPVSGDIYVVTKSPITPAGVYKLKPIFDPSITVTAEKVSNLTVPAVPNGFLTGGDIASDGRHVIICDYFAAYEFVLPTGSAEFDEIWKQKPSVIDLGKREQGEAVAYSTDMLSIFATSEGKHAPLIEAKRREPQ